MKIIRDPKRIHETMVVLTIAASALYFFRHELYWFWISCGIAFTGLFLPWLSEWITSAWMGLAEVLGKISSAIILTLVFFILISPFAFVRRLWKKDAAEKKESSFVDRNHTFSASDLENPW